MSKFQVPTIGGIRKVIHGPSTGVGTTIAEVGSGTITLEQLAAAISNILQNAGTIQTGQQNVGVLVPGPGLSGGGVLTGSVPIRITAPIPWFDSDGGGGDGDPGPPGVAGAAGKAGAAGPVGPVFVVDDGADGDLGPPGPPGPTGAQGNVGTTGGAGPQGPPGAPGDDGADGDQGPPGAAGAKGATGGVGAQGPVGPVMFLDDGPPGDDGAPGPAGQAGANGTTGPAGAQGVPGAVIFPEDGADADIFLVPGTVGPQGATGATGAAGTGSGGSLVGFMIPEDPIDADFPSPLVVNTITPFLDVTGPLDVVGAVYIDTSTAIGLNSTLHNIIFNSNGTISAATQATIGFKGQGSGILDIETGNLHIYTGTSTLTAALTITPTQTITLIGATIASGKGYGTVFQALGGSTDNGLLVSASGQVGGSAYILKAVRSTDGVQAFLVSNSGGVVVGATAISEGAGTLNAQNGLFINGNPVVFGVNGNMIVDEPVDNDAGFMTPGLIGPQGATGTTGSSGGGAGANPGALISLTTQNGAAATFLRSDGAPALDQTISPIMTGIWTFGTPTLATATPLTVYSGTGGNFAATFVASSNTNGQSNGINIEAGVGATDISFAVTSYGGSQSFLFINGNGQGGLGPNLGAVGGVGLTWTTQGLFVFGTPTTNTNGTAALAAYSTATGTTGNQAAIIGYGTTRSYAFNAENGPSIFTNNALPLIVFNSSGAGASLLQNDAANAWSISYNTGTEFALGQKILGWTSAGALAAPLSPLVGNITQVMTGLANFKSGQSTLSTTVLALDTSLIVTANETGWYDIELFLPCYEKILGTAGFKFDLDGGNATVGAVAVGVATNATVGTGVTMSGLATTAAFGTLSTVATNVTWILGNGTINITGAGSIGVRVAQNTLNALTTETTVLVTGASIILTKIR